MKYIIGASIGGLFGLSVPIVMETQQIDEIPRQEVPQLVEDPTLPPIDNVFTLPDNFCGHLDYESTEPKEQAKECLKRSILAVPAI